MANTANIKAVITAEDHASGALKGFGQNVESAGDKARIAFKAVAVAGIAAGTALAGGLTLATKASWDQVSAVQQATVGLNAYEKDATKVQGVLKGLLEFARSDMGVLFNRKDLFAAAQGLKIMGDDTAALTDHVKIMSRSVGLGLSTWDDLNRIIGRVGSTGRLTGEDFDNLTKAGFKLAPSVRNTDQSFASLFKLLDKGIPVDAMEGQANTIQGLGIRLQTAFRGIGDAILGVDSETSKFVVGGLGDRLVKGLAGATTLLKNFKQPIADLSVAFGNALNAIIPFVTEVAIQVGTYLAPKLEALWSTIRNDVLPAIGQFAKALGPVAGVGLVGFIGFAVDALNALLKIVAPVLEYLREHTWIVWGIVGAFAAWKAILFIDAAVASFTAAMNGVNLALQIAAGEAVVTTGKMGGLRTAMMLLAGPWQIALAVIGVAAVVAGINEIADAIEHAKKKLDDFNKEKINVGGQNVSKGSDIGLIQGFKNMFPGMRAAGGPVASGSPYVVGERGPEMFVPGSSGTIVPNNQLGGGTINLSVNIGMYAGTPMEKREIAKSLAKSLQDVARQYGVSPTQLLDGSNGVMIR